MMGLAPTKQTTDLRKGLSDRAIYWIDVPRVGGWRTLWKPDDSRDVYCYFDENHLGDTELVVSHLTPEQAIAATTVVRCRDCKYCRKSFDGRGVVCVLRSLHHFYTDPDGYCSNGKLRDLPSTESAGGQAKVKAQSDYIGKLRGEYKVLDEQMERRCAEYRATIRKLKAELDAATVGAGTCRYIPDDAGFTWWDENDVEHYEEHSASDECCFASCDKCGNQMMVGEEGWFNGWDEITDWWEEDGSYHKGYVLEPRFKYCPNCGKRIVEEEAE